jgi:hypothetical protein
MKGKKGGLFPGKWVDEQALSGDKESFRPPLDFLDLRESVKVQALPA